MSPLTAAFHFDHDIANQIAGQLPVLPGEILITRKAVMAAASREEGEVGEEPDMVLGSNRELVVIDVKPESLDLSVFGLVSGSDWSVPIINTLIVNVRSGEMELSLRLLPPVGSEARKLLEDALQRLRGQAKEAGKKDGRRRGARSLGYIG